MRDDQTTMGARLLSSAHAGMDYTSDEGAAMVPGYPRAKMKKQTAFGAIQ